MDYNAHKIEIYIKSRGSIEGRVLKCLERVRQRRMSGFRWTRRERKYRNDKGPWGRKELHIFREQEYLPHIM